MVAGVIYGSKWIFGQVNDRLEDFLIEKPQGCVFDLYYS